MTGRPASSRAEFARRYPPLIAVFVALALTALVLPSALNLPQTNPTQTLEYAPVPPTDEDTPPVAGNTASLGLATSGSTADDGLGGAGPGGASEQVLPPPPDAPPGTGS